MIAVDSSVWIDYFRNVQSVQTEFLYSMFGQQTILIPDLVLTEVLQGFDTDKDFSVASDLLSRFRILTISGGLIAQQAAQNYRFLRARGITVRKTIDTLIATRCMIDGHHLLYSDRDFDPFVAHLGLISAIGPAH
jgi:predicted nucleic acid-binding protein